MATYMYWTIACLIGMVILPRPSLAVEDVTLDYIADNLAIGAEVVDNLRNQETYTARITLNNTGSRHIGSFGWILYFHSMQAVFPNKLSTSKSKDLEVERMRIGMVQGDLYSMQPIDGFVALQPGESRDYDIEVQWSAVARTDFMPNWYIGSATTPGIRQGFSVKTMNSKLLLDPLKYVKPFKTIRQWKRTTDDRYNPFSGQTRMERLFVKNTGKAEKLIIPTPKSIKIADEGPTMNIDATWTIHNSATGDAAHFLSALTNLKKGPPSVEKTIRLKLSEVGTVPESYSIEIKPDQKAIDVVGHDGDGLFYAVISLYSLLDGYQYKDIPKISIADEPRFHFRGMHLDVARNFHTVADVKRLMGVMAMYKLNKLHLHLSDDEGWRLEIPALPELTQLGAFRCHDLLESVCVIPQFGSGPNINSPGSGYFTVKDYKSLLIYAVEHHVEVIPEFDMPGHSHAAIVSMEQRYRKFIIDNNNYKANEFRLKDPGDTSVYSSVQHWTDNAMNPCRPSTYTFIAKVIDTVIDLHKDIQPLKTFHFGGDEVAKGAWKKSPLCKAFLRSYPQYNMKAGLKMYFLKEVSKITAERGVGLGGWEDGLVDKDGNPLPLEAMDNKNMSANPWNNIWEWGSGQRAYKLANAGYKVILSQATSLYFDHPHEPDPEERGLYWAARFTDTLKVFSFLPDSLYDNIYEKRSGEPLSKTDVCGSNMSKCAALNKKENIIGMQGHLWSETVRTSEDMNNMIFPRLLALAERAWHKAEFEEEGITGKEREHRLKVDWQAFANTLGHKELLRLDELGVQYRIPPPYASMVSDAWVTLNTGKDTTVRKMRSDASDGNRVYVSSAFPGLGIQYKADNGTWVDIPEGLNDWKDMKRILVMRTISADKSRVSREVLIDIDEGTSDSWTIQPTIDYIAENVEVKVSVIDNLHKYLGDYVEMELLLRNTGHEDIKWGQWKIYFYSLYGALQESLTCGLTVDHVNGGLFYFTPSSTFKGKTVIEAGKTLRCIYHNRRWLVSRTDHMPNWYVGSTGMEAKVINNTADENLRFVGEFKTSQEWKRSKEDKYNPYTPEVRYDMHSIKDTGFKAGSVVPTPLDVSMNESFSLTFSQKDGWPVIPGAFFQEADFLADKLNVRITSNAPTANYIVFKKVQSSEKHPEAYHLNIDPATNIITISAEDAAGAMHGSQTLISLIEADGGKLVKMTITDKPRFSYRGVMLDVARNFKPVEWIFTFLDAMSMYKLNKLHLHLTDDEAWRIEIPGIPELTEVASNRCQSDFTDSCLIPQLGSGPDTSTSGSGYYTVDDYLDILRHASERHITVIPEVDVPAHSAAAISAMAYRETKIKKMKSHQSRQLIESYLLDDIAYEDGVKSVQSWKINSINPCLASSYKFIEKVVDGLRNMHVGSGMPLDIFHIGGDEVPEGVWNKSMACQSNPETKDMSTASLKRMFMKKVADILSSRNLNLATCEDGVYTDNKPNPRSDFKTREVFVYPWNNRWELGQAQRSSEFANEGYKVVVSLATHLYLDQQYEPDPEERGLYWASRNTDTRKIFGLMPDSIFANADVTRMGDPVDLNAICNNKACPMPENPANIIGLQAFLWSETIRTEEQLHFMGFPRLLGLAERAWHKASWEDISDVKTRKEKLEKDWETFANTLGYKELPRLERNGIQYRIPPPGAKLEDNTLHVNTRYPQHVVDLSTDNGNTWLIINGTKFIPDVARTLHLRSRSKELNRTSRVITFVMPTASTATELQIAASLVMAIATLVYILKA